MRTWSGALRAVQSKDARFDGWFFTAVLTTGIYCRPSCPAVPPKAQNMRFYPSAAAAQQAGFRACKRCRPDASPGSPEWNERADVVARAMRLIADGVVDRDGVPGLARRLGYSTRQVERQLLAELGAGPLALARAQRAQTARLLIETTALPMTDVAFAAGFASIRTFNDTVREVFALSPPPSCAAASPRRGARPTTPGALSLRLPFRRRCARTTCSATSPPPRVPGRRGVARRRLPAHPAPARTAPASSRCTPAPDHIACQLSLTDLRDLSTAISRCRRLLDLDADPVAVDDLLADDPVLAPRSTRRPAGGCRAPSTARSSRSARCSASRCPPPPRAPTPAGWSPRTASRSTTPTAGSPTCSPPPARWPRWTPRRSPCPQARRRTPHRRWSAPSPPASSTSAPAATGSEARDRLAALPGIGPWTVELDRHARARRPRRLPRHRPRRPRAPPASSACRRPRPRSPATPRRWRPWRAYAVQYLWATGDHPINHLPADSKGTPP